MDSCPISFPGPGPIEFENDTGFNSRTTDIILGPHVPWMTGLSKDAGCIMGVRRTLNVDSDLLWELITSKEGMVLLTGDPANLDGTHDLDKDGGSGVHYKVTTFIPYSHFRMWWRKEGWTGHSILQVRVIGKEGGRSVLAFHQEKLSDESIRDQMLERWKGVIDRIEESISGGWRV